jgi:predicted nucleotidyltransferase
MSAEFDKLLPTLVGGGVQFILVGGVAAIVHGAARITYDIDVVYDRSAVNLKKLASTLKPLSPYLRGAPPGLPFSEQVEAFGVKFKCVDLPTLIKLKRSAGRPKDLEARAELNALLEERERD